MIEVNNQHYKLGDPMYEAIKVIEAHKLDFIEGNIIKYLLRYKDKNGLEDLKKAQWYLDRLIKNNSDQSYMTDWIKDEFINHVNELNRK